MGKEYDLIIVGGGIIGSALLYTASTYMDIKSVLLLEKYEDVALLNSSSNSNSQTLHWGDIRDQLCYRQGKKGEGGFREDIEIYS